MPSRRLSRTVESRRGGSASRELPAKQDEDVGGSEIPCREQGDPEWDVGGVWSIPGCLPGCCGAADSGRPHGEIPDGIVSSGSAVRRALPP
jgi:hypothetical protein